MLEEGYPSKSEMDLSVSRVYQEVRNFEHISSVFGSGDETSPKFMFITPILMNWVDTGLRHVSLV